MAARAQARAPLLLLVALPDRKLLSLVYKAIAKILYLQHGLGLKEIPQVMPFFGFMILVMACGLSEAILVLL